MVCISGAAATSVLNVGSMGQALTEDPAKSSSGDAGGLLSSATSQAPLPDVSPSLACTHHSRGPGTERPSRRAAARESLFVLGRRPRSCGVAKQTKEMKPASASCHTLSGVTVRAELENLQQGFWEAMSADRYRTEGVIPRQGLHEASWASIEASAYRYQPHVCCPHGL